MIPNNNLNKILIIDFGSQFTQLIARRVRELGVYSEIISHKKLNLKLEKKRIKGIILSGGPLNVYQSKKVRFNFPCISSSVVSIVNFLSFNFPLKRTPSYTSPNSSLV